MSLMESNQLSPASPRTLTSLQVSSVLWDLRMTIRDSGETLRDLAETAWQMILCLQARSQRGRTGLALGDYVLKLILIDQQGSKSGNNNISEIITIKTYDRRNRIARRWRNWFGAARQGLPRRQAPSSQAGWKKNQSCFAQRCLLHLVGLFGAV